MIKAKTILEHKIGERTYEFCCSPDSPLGEIFDSLTQMRAFVIDRMNESTKPPEKKED